ncbi:MAG TPA: hypothetical protein ENF78_02360 [Candidatus Bathyarchaeota archaeon]|nr:hypothetical protein [Candidatus Bathyarchaeota archaeon]
MVVRGSLLTDEDRELLRRVHALLEEVLETLEILADKELMKALKEAEEDVRAGRVRDYEEFIKELREAGET